MSPRDWSFITRRGGGGGSTKWLGGGGGANEVLPLQKPCWHKWGTTSFGVVLIRELEVLAIMKGVGVGHKKCFHPLKGGEVQNVLDCLERLKASDLRFSNFVDSPPPPFKS